MSVTHDGSLVTTGYVSAWFGSCAVKGQAAPVQSITAGISARF